MKKDKNIEAFFAILRAGLWEQDINLASTDIIDFNEVYRTAEEQSVVGLVAAGIEHMTYAMVPQADILQFVGKTLQLEQLNRAMNDIIAELISKMRSKDIYTLLVKGQGVAQCYERPLWRACGDIDFYLSEDDFNKAKTFFRPLVDSFDPDDNYTCHINMHYGQWVVEIHANQYCSLSRKINRVLNQIHTDLFYSGNVRSWLDGETQVFIPAADNDVILSFTHFLNHFYNGGLGVRQICDWSRLIWTFREELNIKLLESRIREMGLLSEWKAFGAFAVECMGMPSEAMPFYENSRKWSSKAERIKRFIIEVGNFGHNRESICNENQPRIVRKALSYRRRVSDLFHHAFIFPWDSFRFLFGITINGIRAALHGE